MEKKYRLLVVSASDLSYDGRLRELVSVCEKIGETVCISTSKENVDVSKNNQVYAYRDKMNYISFLSFCVQKLKRLGEFDLILADNRKGLIPAYIFGKAQKKCLLVCDSRELYISSEVKHFVGKMGCFIEKIFNKKFDVVISANEERADIMKEMYGLTKRPLVFENLRELEIDSTVINELEVKNSLSKFEYVFVSTAGCDLSRLTADYVESIGKFSPEVALVLVGCEEGNDKKEIEKIIKDNDYNNIFLLPRMKQEELSAVLSVADVGIVAYHQNDINNKFCASGKVYEYIYAGLPVLCSTNPPLKNFCEKYKVGVAQDNITIAVKEIINQYEFFLSNVKKVKEEISIEKNREELKTCLVDYLAEL